MTEAVLSRVGVLAADHDRTITGPAGGPVQPGDRIALIDVLRGFALFGILVVNWGWDSKFLQFVAWDSFRPLFSLLFGFGFAIQLIRPEEKGRPVVIRYLWRTALLLLIGGVHYLIWSGDIAHRYALTAVLLLLFVRTRPTMLLGAAAVLMVLHIAPNPALNVERRFWQRPDPELAESERAERVRRGWPGFESNRLLEQGRADGEVAARLAGEAANFSQLLQRAYRLDLIWWKNKAEILCMFLLGLYAGRRRILHEPAQHRRLFVGVLVAGLLIGIAGNTLEVFGDWVRSVVALPAFFQQWRIGHIGNIALTLAYLSAVTLLFTYRERARRLLAPLGHVGRMSLTNYVMQAVILTGLIGGGALFGNGLFPQLRTLLVGWWNMPLLVAVFALQVLYSRWWFQRFQFGPLEWAWRSAIWFRWQPMRVRGEQRAPA